MESLCAFRCEACRFHCPDRQANIPFQLQSFGNECARGDAMRGANAGTPCCSAPFQGNNRIRLRSCSLRAFQSRHSWRSTLWGGATRLALWPEIDKAMVRFGTYLGMNGRDFGSSGHSSIHILWRELAFWFRPEAEPASFNTKNRNTSIVTLLRPI